MWQPSMEAWMWQNFSCNDALPRTLRERYRRSGLSVAHGPAVWEAVAGAREVSACDLSPCALAPRLRPVLLSQQAQNALL